MRFRPTSASVRSADRAAPPPQSSDHVAIGARVVARDAITTIGVVHQSERDIDGQILNFSIYLLIAAAFLIAVVEMGWQSRFLLATGFFAAVGLMSMVDVILANRITYWRIDVGLTSGETVTLAVHSEAQRDRWLAYLQAA